MPDSPLILAIDQGTTNTKAVLVDQSGDIVGISARPVDIEYPRPGWVQQDAQAIWATVRECIDEVILAAGSPALSAIGISNQRESGVAWEASTGRAVGPVVSWQCRRSSELCDGLREAGVGDRILARTGLPLDPGFTAGKWRWLLDAASDGRARAEDGEIRLGTVDSWLLWNLTGGSEHRTDVSNASRTQLLDLERAEWEDWLLDAFGVPKAALPTIDPSSRIVGHTMAIGALHEGIPIAALIGDSHAALFGHAGFQPGTIKSTYGTGSSLMMATPQRLEPEHGITSTVAWGVGRTIYALEGNIYVTGAAVQWVADFGGLDGPAAVADLAASIDGTAGVYLVPAFVGLGAPHWDDQARGLISGLTRGSTMNQLAQAALESIAYQVRDVFDRMGEASGQELTVLLADGGVTRNDRLMQFQADILGVPVQRNDTPELSALGAAYLAGLATGVWRDTAEIAALPRSVVRFDPDMQAEQRASLYRGWQDALARSVLRPR